MERSTAVVGSVVGVLLVATIALWTGVWIQALNPGTYERTTVTVLDEDGTELGTVDTRVADGWQKRIVGLSRTESLGADEGMVFVHDNERRHAYVMRDMAFPLDIVFFTENGTVTRVHHAAVPPEGGGEGSLEQYAGVGTYVLEVNRGWTNRTGVTVGDRVVIPNRTGDAAAATDGATTQTSTAASPSTTSSTRTTSTPSPTPTGPTVTAIDANGTELATVRVAIANDSSERYTGLSDTESLAADEGMLFVFPNAGEYNFVMRRMDFPLDIVFVAENGTVTRIHHAPVPDGEYEREYPGEGKYVLEVNRGWTNETGLDVGDRLILPAVTS